MAYETSHEIAHEIALPGAGLKDEKMPGHWLLARLGKRVLRPGGLALTHAMQDALQIGAHDRVVEFAPGMGITARMTLARRPASYRAVEADENAAAQVRQCLQGAHQQCTVGSADDTGLPSQCATVVYVEAMLTMQTPVKKAQIMQEALRLLEPGGRFGFHEMCLVPDDLAEPIKAEIRKALSDSIHIGARPLTVAEWRRVCEEQGFAIQAQATVPMRLLEPQRMIQDEGLLGALQIGVRIAMNGVARRRVQAMRRIFKQYEGHLAAIMIVAVKAA